MRGGRNTVNTNCRPDNSNVETFSPSATHQRSLFQNIIDESSKKDRRNTNVANQFLRKEKEHTEPIAIYNGEGSQSHFHIDGSGITSRSQPIMTRPRTSIARPNTAATIFLESCSSSLYSDASFDEDLSSSLSDWDDNDLPSIESLVSSRSEDSHSESDMILESLEVNNVGEGNQTNTTQLCHQVTTPNKDISEISHLEKKPMEFHDPELRYPECNYVMPNNNIPSLTEEELTLSSISEENDPNLNCTLDNSPILTCSWN